MFRFDAGGDPRAHQEYAEGAFSVQELGAALVGFAVGTRAGDRVLDVCAGRGQKTMILAEAAGEAGAVVATDLHAHKVEALGTEARRMSRKVRAERWDWTQGIEADWRGSFDRVLVDAPCSGVGTLRRRPEIMRRLTPSDPARLAELQWDIVRHAVQAVRAGGELLFATCSVLRDEGPLLVERICRHFPFEVSAADGPLDRYIFGPSATSDRAIGHLLPIRHGTDGYFLARLKRTTDD